MEAHVWVNQAGLYRSVYALLAILELDVKSKIAVVLPIVWMEVAALIRMVSATGKLKLKYSYLNFNN